MDIEIFKNDLRSNTSELFIRSHVLSGDTHILSAIEYAKLREEVACHFSIDPFQIYMVGSGKMGFSIKESRRFGVFDDNSDIDLAIICPELFQKVWQSAYIYKLSKADWPRQKSFFDYLVNGWIRPDKFPKADLDPFFDEWWSFFDNLTRSRKYGHYKIRAGLYQSRFFLEQYQKICLEQCKEII